MENYEILKKIGSGSFAKVYTAIHKPTGRKVALKVIRKRKMSTSKLRQRLEREISNLQLLQHENIAQYYESFETDKEMYIAMEYVSGGELFDFIAEKHGIDEVAAQNIFSQIAAAVQHCHKNNISHRDLKLENILLCEDGKPKLIDFGLSTMSHPTAILATYCGSALYASPEMIAGKPYKGPECDIWSLGVILYCMLTACMPFDDQEWGSFVTCVNRADYPIPSNLSQNAVHLLSRMLDPCSKTRATITEVLCHPWLIPRKSSLQLPHNITKRRVGISHSRSDALQITKAILAEVTKTCTCTCHSQDCGIGLHCEECEPITHMRHSFRPLHYDNIKTSLTSICSSGYSSSSDSLPNSPHTTDTTNLCYESIPLKEDENVELVFV